MERNREIILGKQVDFPEQYCRDILTAIPRCNNREIYDIKEDDGLFYGFDCWHAYEASFLLNNGTPVCGVLKIVYSSDSPYIVESKSLKLYLGSFNMTPLGKNLESGVEKFVRTIKEDLEYILSEEVRIYFHRNIPSSAHFDFNDYPVLEDSLDLDSITCSIYNEHPAYLSENIVQNPGEMNICTHLLRSNCKITNQPDWGSIYIRIKASRLPDKISLLKYIVSLRAENHFHEEICEMIFKRLTDTFQPEILMVCCLYTRRGGIDICPVRSNKAEFLPPYLINEQLLTPKTLRQ
ncbi:NADPH-dependent 7-cyano-7-deazaguanine reductase QueF [Odoribacter sp. OttesenSCG-928-J03]|nr:NADPH-dependent 7-cyano-7-deazaguanine reductase QueF [Odoribacter sp. OttesenSCG-928-J03]MDL2283103.1 NADPH-dependent 7-cyano-7-deazaguanine reductase QueF [Odoribacter sp. OttesenSCG-928-G04]MDL2331141.1 NADPH-dependent 7-cyano-7-deazaguanine reductase QueF [Odoribacter sp. OttesenSCG-928-A06]